MLLPKALFDDYDLMIPPKHEGGYLLLALYEKIQQNELEEPFTDKDIKRVWEEIPREYQKTDPYDLSGIIQKLGNHLIKDEIGEYGKYRLTQYACALVELLIHKVENLSSTSKCDNSFPLEYSVI